MCKIYIETSDLDNAIRATLEDALTGHKGKIIDLLESKELKTISTHVAMASNYTEEVTQASHTLKLGILIGLKLAEYQLTLDYVNDGIAEVA